MYRQRVNNAVMADGQEVLLNTYAPPLHNGLDILYQDEWLLAVNKPAGLLSVPGRGPHKQDCMLSRVQAEFTDALTVHRLDMETSGIVLFARGKHMERELSIQFQQRLIHKQYVAVVAGCLQPVYGEISLPLASDWPNRPRQQVSFRYGKPSLTRYRVMAWDKQPETTRVWLEPVTGRSHQLRVHLQAIGYPILGDALYADSLVQACSDRLLLHAVTIRLRHPLTGYCLTIKSPLPF